MNIADFFVSLKIKGDDKAGKSLETVNSKIKDIGSSSLAAKAALIGAMYGLEQMMSSQMNAGAGMVNFAASTDLSIQKLQDWKYAAQQFNVAGESVEGSLKGIQNSMWGMRQGKAAPAGMAMMADEMRKHGEKFDINKGLDMDYMLDNLQKLANSGPAALVKDKVMSFGVSEDVFTGMRQGAFTKEALEKAHANPNKYSDNQAKSLSHAKAMFANLGQGIEVGLGKIMAKHGPELIKEIGTIVPQVMKLISTLVLFGEKAEVFHWIGEAFKGWGLIFSSMNDALDKLKEYKDADMKNNGQKGWFFDHGNFEDRIKNQLNPPDPKIMKPVGDMQLGSSTVNQTLNFHNVKDPKAIGSEVGRAVKAHVNTSPAKGRKN